MPWYYSPNRPNLQVCCSERTLREKLNFLFACYFRAAASTRKRFCLVLFGEGSEEKERRRMVSHGGQPCKCILRVKRNFLVCHF